MMSPSKDVPRLLDLWRAGRLKLEPLATRAYRLEDVNQGYADMHAGRNIRGPLRTVSRREVKPSVFSFEMQPPNWSAHCDRAHTDRAAASIPSNSCST
jgi:hypothetical protein